MSIDADSRNIFDQPSLWRMEAALDLGLDGDNLIAALSPGPAFPAVLHSLKAALACRPKVIVDLGAGTGGVSEWLRVRTGATVFAVEPEAGARRAARRAFPHLRVIEGSAESTPLPGGSADAVIMSGVTSLLSDISPAVAESDRLLTRSGCIAIADLFSVTTDSWCSAPNIFRSIDDVTRILRRHDFTVISVGCGKPVPDAPWASAAGAVDDWVEIHCADRPEFNEWSSDQQHLQHHIRSGNLIGGCLVARRLPEHRDKVDF